MFHPVIQAQSPEHYAECEALLAKQYALHSIPHAGLSLWAHAGAVQRLMLMRGGMVAGSIDIIEDSAVLGLPVDAYYPEEMVMLRGTSNRVCEVGAFASDTPHLLPTEREALFTEVCCRLIKMKLDVAVCGINPENARMYRIFMGWEIASESRTLPGSRVPVVLMKLTEAGFKGSAMYKRMPERIKP